MQCPSCQFENMPGVQACGRCGTSLQLGATAISVYPPRASAWAKWWRRHIWSPRINWRRIAEAADNLLLGNGVRRYPDWRLIVRTVVPGWPQLYQGNRTRGWTFLGTFLGLAFLAISSLGTWHGSIFLGLAVATHASSVLDLVIAETGQTRARFTYAIICLAGVGLAVYWPVGRVVGELVVPRQITANLPPFVRGDIVLSSPGLYALRRPRPGDVVLYEVPTGRVAGRYAGRGAYYAIQGQRIDRILASAGQHVQVHGTRLLVDDRASDYLPLNPARMPGGFDVTVPAGFYFILPTTALGENIGLEGLDWQQVSLVPSYQILGRVYVRHWPWHRFTLF